MTAPTPTPTRCYLEWSDRERERFAAAGRALPDISAATVGGILDAVCAELDGLLAAGFAWSRGECRLMIRGPMDTEPTDAGRIRFPRFTPPR